MNTLTAHSSLKKACIGIDSRRCSNCAVGTRVDILHALGFLPPIFWVILYDTKRVDPEVLYAQVLSDPDSITECLWELRDIETVLSRFDVLSGCAELGQLILRDFTPAMGKCKIFQHLILVRTAETQSADVCSPNIKKSAGRWCSIYGQAVVRFITPFQPCSK